MPPLNRSPDWDRHEMALYQRIFVCFIDYNRGVPLPADATPEQRRHKEMCDHLWDFFERYTDAVLFAIIFVEGSTPADWVTRWAQHKQNWIDDSLVFIYFHGKASLSDDEVYTWTIPGVNAPINAIHFMRDLNTTQADITYLLDCGIPTRFVRYALRDRNHAATEFVLAGYGLETGQQAHATAGHWTRAFVRNLTHFIRGRTADGQRRSKAEICQSTPQIMKMDKRMHNDAQRIWLHKTSKGGQLKIWRTVVDPVLSRIMGRLQFCKKTIQRGVPPSQPVQGVGIQQQQQLAQGPAVVPPPPIQPVVIQQLPQGAGVQQVVQVGPAQQHPPISGGAAVPQPVQGGLPDGQAADQVVDQNGDEGVHDMQLDPPANGLGNAEGMGQLEDEGVDMGDDDAQDSGMGGGEDERSLFVT